MDSQDSWAEFTNRLFESLLKDSKKAHKCYLNACDTILRRKKAILLCSGNSLGQ